MTMTTANDFVLDGYQEVEEAAPSRNVRAKADADAELEDMLHTWGFVQNPPPQRRSTDGVADTFWAQRYYDYREAQERRIAMLLGIIKPRSMMQSIEAQADAEKRAQVADMVERAWRMIPDWESRNLLKVMYVDRTVSNAARARLRVRKAEHLNIKVWRARNYIKRNIDFIKNS